MGGAAVQLQQPDTTSEIAPQADAPIYSEESRRTYGMRCPHCRAVGLRRSSREITVTFRETYYVCGNPACGHAWKASTQYEYGLSPSAIPDPAVDLPLRPQERVPGVTVMLATGPPEPDPDQPTFFD